MAASVRRIPALSLAVGVLALMAAGPAAAPARAGTTGPGYGAVIAWGNDNEGQIEVPSPVSGGGMTAVAASGRSALALDYNGKVYAWGDNSRGQANVPSAANSGVSAISSGGTFSVALKNGGVLAWGDDTYHQTEVPAAAKSGVLEVKAGANFVVARKSDGSLIAWGDNSHGATTIPTVAVKSGGLWVFKPLTGVTRLSAAGHVLALRHDGSVKAWGLNTSGQINVPGSLTGVKSVAAGGNFSLALVSGGTVTAWGGNDAGQLNTPCQMYNMISKKCVQALSGMTAIAAGDKHAVAIKADGSLVAWGDNSHGQTKVPAKDFAPYVAVAAGADFGLAIMGKVGVPFPPSAVVAGAGNAEVGIGYAGTGDHGVAITTCTIHVSPGGKKVEVPYALDQYGWSHGLVTGLTNGTTYSFTVSCKNALGEGSESSPPVTATPLATKAMHLVLSPRPGFTGAPTGGAPASATAPPVASASATGSVAASASAAESAAAATSVGAPVSVAVSPSGSVIAPGSAGNSGDSGSSGGSNSDNAPLLIVAVAAAGVAVVGGGLAFWRFKLR